MNNQLRSALAELLSKLEDIEQEIIDLSENFDANYHENSLLSRASSHIGQATEFIMRVYDPEKQIQ